MYLSCRMVCMYTIVGLGNPGKQYANTRHNAGRIVLGDFLATHGFPGMVRSSQFGGEISEGMVEGTDVRVLFPGTYMNVSGTSVKKVVAADTPPEQLIVVYDDLDLPLGTLRISKGRGAGGHNGIDSIITEIGSKDFVRVRIGIAPVSFFGKLKKPQGSARVSRFVLGTLSGREEKKLAALEKTVTEALTTVITRDAHIAMNTYNERG